MLQLRVSGTQLAIITPGNQERDLLNELIIKKYVTFAFRRNKYSSANEIDAVYSVSTASGNIYFHSAALTDVENLFNTHGVMYTVVIEKLYTPIKASFTLAESIVVRDYQETAIDFLSDPSKGPAVLLGFPPGAGKTITFIAYAAKKQERFALVAKPGYCSQWLKVLPSTTDLTQKDIVFVNSGKVLIDLQKKIITGEFTATALLFSNKVVQSWLKPTATDKYLMSVEDFMRRAGIGTVVIDEVHEDLHFNYLLCASIAVPKVIGLSATLVTRDRKIERFQQQMFPLSDRHDLLMYAPYIKYIECQYTFPYGMNPIVSQRGSVAYSHVSYEGWLLNNNVMLVQFLGSICQLVTTVYLARRKPGEKILIFAMQNEMCESIHAALEAYCSEDIKIALHITDSPYATLLEHDIIVSSPIKAGAAVDIPGLIAVISTYMTASIQRLIQMLGRLRNIPDRDTIYIQLVGAAIDKHISYQTMNKDIVEVRVAEYHSMCLPTFQKTLPR